jgi:hypothetical protein
MLNTPSAWGYFIFVEKKFEVGCTIKRFVSKMEEIHGFKGAF